MTQNSGASIDRRSRWLAIAAAAGVVIAIVALIVAISAKNASNSDARITAQVNQDARLAVGGIHSQLQRDVASATAVLRQLEVGSAAASRTDNKLLRDVSQNKSSAATNRSNIAKMQASITALTAEVHKLSGTVTTLGTNQQALTRRVNALEKTRPHP